MPILKSEMRFRLISKIKVGRAEILQFLMIPGREREERLDQQTAMFYNFYNISIFDLFYKTPGQEMCLDSRARAGTGTEVQMIDGLLTGSTWSSRPM